MSITSYSHFHDFKSVKTASAVAFAVPDNNMGTPRYSVLYIAKKKLVPLNDKHFLLFLKTNRLIVFRPNEQVIDASRCVFNSSEVL